MSTNVLYGIFNLSMGILIILFSIPLIMRKIKMNSIYGVRIPQSFKSEENWYRINAYGGKQMILWSLPMILIGILCLSTTYYPHNENTLAIVCGLCPIALFIGGSIFNILRWSRKNLD